MTERDWQPIATCPPDTWVRTRRDEEAEENVCVLRQFLSRDAGGRVITDYEWVERATGVTTVTHSTFAPPTYWCALDTFCVGLLLDHELPPHVVLIEKNHPTEQTGRLNGLGGRVLSSEPPLEAMRREFREEAGLDVLSWQTLAQTQGPTWSVHFFYAHHSLANLRCGRDSPTSEIVVVRTINKVVDDPALMIDLRWLLPLALDHSVVKPVRIVVRE